MSRAHVTRRIKERLGNGHSYEQVWRAVKATRGRVINTRCRSHLVNLGGRLFVVVVDWRSHQIVTVFEKEAHVRQAA